MYTRARIHLLRGLPWTSAVALPAALWSAGLTAAHWELGMEWLRLPALPVGVLGTAVSFYLGFKGSAAYDRMWEARKIWGGIVNTSRTWGNFVTQMVTDHHRQGPAERPLEAVHRDLVYRHIAWLAALRLQLRRPKPWEHRRPWNNRWRKRYGTLDTSDERLLSELEDFVSEAELSHLKARRNRATQLVQLQGQQLKSLFAEGRLDDFRHMELARLLETMYTLQGKAERIKNFPMPRQYATANHWFVMVFLLLLPFALLDAFHMEGQPALMVWATVPVATLVSWVFWTWDQVLEYTENPFEGLVNDIPMDSLSRTIEIDLREMLGETSLPKPVGPAAPHVQM